VRRWAFILAERRRGVANVPAAVQASDGAGA
jgi:hypothetical protein